MRKTKSLKIVSVILAFALLIGGSFAYLTDYASTSESGNTGTVAISVDGNFNLLNNDGADILLPGAMRCLNYKVQNEGNAAIKVRTTLAMTVTSNTGQELILTGDANTQSEYDIYQMVDVVEKEGYGWNPIETAVPLQEKTITDGTTIIYELDEYVLNGNSERYNESEVIDGVEEYFKECDYAFLVKKSLGNEWQNSKITLQLLVQAKQYRNSGDWGDVHTETIEIGGSEKDVVPDETIITNQGTVYMVDGVTFASLIPANTTDVVIDSTLTAPRQASTYSSRATSFIDFSAEGDESIVGWMEDTTLYVTSAKNEKIILNEDCGEMFIAKENLKTVKFAKVDSSKVKTMYSMYYNSQNLETIDMTGIDTSNVENFRSFVNSCTSLKEIKGLESFKTSKVTTFTKMFSSCSSLTDIDVHGWDTKSAQSVEYMFYGCSALKTIKGLEKFDTRNVTSFLGFVYGCESLEEINLSNFNTSKATTMKSMFSGCKNLKNLDFSSFDTSAVTDFSFFVNNCSGLTSIKGMQNWNTSSATTMNSMFSGCSKITRLDLISWNVSRVSNLGKMFKGCTALDIVFAGNWTSQIPSGATSTDMFDGCEKLYSSSVLDTATYANQNNYFYAHKPNMLKAGSRINSAIGSASVVVIDNTLEVPTDVTVVDLSVYEEGNLVGWQEGATYYITTLDNSKIEFNASSNDMFREMTNLTKVKFNGVDTSKATTFAYMFYKCTKLSEIEGLNQFNPQTVTTMERMFMNCHALKTLDLSGWNLAKLKTLSYTFYKMGAITSIDFTAWKTPSLTDLSFAFGESTKLTDLKGIGGWTTSKVTSTLQTFCDCESLVTLDLSNWTMESNSRVTSMFQGCKNLETVYAQDWSYLADTIKTSSFRSTIFYGCDKLKQKVGSSSGAIEASLMNPTTGYFTDPSLKPIE